MSRNKVELYRSRGRAPIRRRQKPLSSLGLVGIIISIVLALLPIPASFGEEPKLNHARLSVFGTRLEITISGAEPALVHRATNILSNDFKKMHRDWHAWKPGALVNVNQGLARQQVVQVDDSLLTLIQQAKDFYSSSDGLFNPAMGQLIGLWGFHSDQRPHGPPPDKKAIARLQSLHPTMDDITVTGNQIGSSNSAVQLDFGGFAKGHAVDLAIKRLRELGIENAIINAGGDLRVIGRHGQRPWRVGIQHPQGNGVLAWLEANNDESVFTSGNYERYREHDGIRYAHIIDPRTGYPVKEIISATVVHRNGALADAAATALTVAGISSWQRIAQRMKVETVMLVDSKGTVYMSKSMEKRINFSGNRPSNIVIGKNYH